MTSKYQAFGGSSLSLRLVNNSPLISFAVVPSTLLLGARSQSRVHSVLF